MSISTIDFSLWRLWLWPVGILLVFGLIFYFGFHWWKIRRAKSSPILFLFEQLLWNFRAPLALICISSCAIITLGFVAGTRVSTILMVVISALTVAGIGLIAWAFWPKQTADGNLFDLFPVPQIEWPIYENDRDLLMRSWIEERAAQLKADPSPFQGSRFGVLALEIMHESAKIYNKKTPLSISLRDLASGLERTAADLKILTNHLPLVGHFTLAEIEREIDYTRRHGRPLYIALFLVLSLFNPGNLVRVLLAFVRQKSPWQHLFLELQSWTYSHFALRLGYHLSLIHSQRKPPPPHALRRVLVERELQQQQDRLLRRQKMGWLALISLFGFFFYLGLQIVNATLVFGWPVLLLNLAMLITCILGIYKIRSARLWTRLWHNLLPLWPEETPPLTQRDRNAKKQMREVRNKHAPPIINSIDQLKKLPKQYGKLLLKLWDECGATYRQPQDITGKYATREWMLPQFCAGTEDFCISFRKWIEGDALLARTLRQLEALGFDLETLYQYLQRKQQQPINEEHVVDEPKASTDTKSTSEKEHQLVISATDEARNGSPYIAPHLHIHTSVNIDNPLWSFAKSVGKAIGNAIKDIAISSVHKRVLELIDTEFEQRLIKIYGARYPRQVFEPVQTTQQLKLLVIGRSHSHCQSLLDALIPQQTALSTTLTSEEQKQQQPPHANAGDKTYSPAESNNDLQDQSPDMRSYQMPDGQIYYIESVRWTSPDHFDFNGLPISLEQRIQQQSYIGIVLIDEIDYGARERIAEFLNSQLLPRLRTSEIGTLALALIGVEKLKPLNWKPPYDDYLQEEPSQRKSQRIRNAVLAWHETIKDSYPLDLNQIFPIGIPNDSEPWGIDKLRQFLRLSNG
jgi:hypothetical protein